MKRGVGRCAEAFGKSEPIYVRPKPLLNTPKGYPDRPKFTLMGCTETQALAPRLSKVGVVWSSQSIRWNTGETR